ncbi:MAG: 1-deoxy-D-xylulose-5-phosphate synthase [Bacteroidales bacterium]|nr:1-deoxy-D-xylulose-5-phosphate synthase [Bacteroidales bacterium]
MYGLLDNIDSPEDLRRLSPDELPKLCSEIRDYMVECCATNPGHVGSSLGAVELIVGLHYIYNTPEDRIVYDVSHQTYAHKILTCRREAFRDNRKLGGISGFTKMSESEYDAFGAGHSSTSISAALGLEKALRFRGLDSKVVALIGDGALTGGEAYEGLNNAGDTDTDLLIILNDNNISIDQNIGSIHKYLLRITTDPAYNRLKDHVWQKLGEGGFRNFIQKWTRTAKTFFVKNDAGALFSALGFRYFGPIDGNDISQVVGTLAKMRSIKGPKILHAITTKGKGFAPAEEDQTTWHAPGMFDPETGKRIKTDHNGRSRYQDIFGETLLRLAREDSRIVGVTPAMASGCGMNLLAGEMPERFFDVGIAEQHAVTFAAGLAAGGMKPFCNIYSSFSQRAYDQIIHDIALQKLPVVLCFDRAGLVGEDGPTHHGVFDLAAYRPIPNVTIAVPADETELRDMMYTASKAAEGPFIIRYPRGYGRGLDWRSGDFSILEPGRGVLLTPGSDAPVAILALGPFAADALEAVRRSGLSARVYNMRYLKPLDMSIVDEVLASCTTVVTVEDGTVAGGLFGAVSEIVSARGLAVRVVPVGVGDSFVTQGTQEELRDSQGLSVDKLSQLIASISIKK